jgi:hypothetical protein
VKIGRIRERERREGDVKEDLVQESRIRKKV